MPTFNWPDGSTELTQDFAKRRGSDDAGKLLRVAMSCVNELHYLDDIDQVFDADGTRRVPGSHHSSVVDFAHARWAMGTCITAVDLCAAALGRAVGGHTGDNDLDLNYFKGRHTKPGVVARFGQMPKPAQTWIDAVFDDPEYGTLRDVRDALTHQWIHAQFTLGARWPPERLKLGPWGAEIPLRQLVTRARAFAAAHVPSLIMQLRQI